jgi:Ran GTPase-activating protein (RanGAP) involved in mRNA processing and transport
MPSDSCTGVSDSSSALLMSSSQQGRMKQSSVCLNDQLAEATLHRIIQERVVVVKGNTNTSLTRLQLGRGVCRMLGAERSAHLLQSLRHIVHLQRLDIHDNEICGEGVAAIQRLAARSKTLQVLSLQRCSLDFRAMVVIAQGLMSKACSITELDLAGNRLPVGHTECVFQSISQMLIKNTCLELLNLSSISHVEADINPLGRGLAKNTSLRCLRLRNNFLMLEHNKNFLGGLTRNTSLETLDLSDNFIKSGGAWCLARALECNSHLQHLSLASNQIGADGAVAIGCVLVRTNNATNNNRPNLRHIDLSCNNIAHGASFIGDALKKNPSIPLACLNLERNSLRDGDIEAMAQGLALATGVHTLNLAGARVGKASVTRIAQSMACLTHLDISHWGDVGDDGATILAQALQHTTNTCLQYLDISNINIHSKGMWAICTSLCHNTTLLALSLRGGFKDRDSDLAMAHFLSVNTTLQHLDLSQVTSHGPFWKHTLGALARRNTTLLSLDLHGDRRDDSALADLLLNNVCITHIDMSCKLGRTDKTITTLANSIIQRPRYHSLHLRGSELGRMPSLTHPQHTHDDMHTYMHTYTADDDWTDEDALVYIQHVHFSKFLGFAMAQHMRLGGMSVARNLSPDIVRVVMMCYFGLPLNFFDQDRCRAPAESAPAYMSLLKAAEFP